MSFLVDLAERVGLTFVEAFLGVLLVAPVFNLDVSTLHAAAMGGAAAAAAVAKGMIAKRLGQPGTASLVDGGVDELGNLDTAP